MTLFAALGENNSGVSTPTSPCSPPTAIQLHGRHAFDFIHDRIIRVDDVGDATQNSPRPSLLSYQAIQTQRDDDDELKSHDKPDLGVWNCSVEYNFDRHSLGGVLKNVVLQTGSNTTILEEEKKDNHDNHARMDTVANTVLMTIHLQDLSDVQPTLERMRSVLVAAFDHENGHSHDYGKAASQSPGTTYIKTLEASSFGRCQIKQDIHSQQQQSGRKIALILAVITPSSTDQGDASVEYQHRQRKSLVVYHLHKFALEVNCTLCFVHEANGNTVNDSPGHSKNMQSTMSMEELAVLIRRVAMGLSPVVDAVAAGVLGESTNENEHAPTSVNEESNSNDTPPAATTDTSVYPPGSHDAELIYGAMLRNASCEGKWDAAKHDLNVALPPQSPSKNSSATNSAKNDESQGGDEEWLSRLASSVGISVDTVSANSSIAASASGAAEALTPIERKKEMMKKKKSSKNVAASSVLNSDKDPSDFFANLLKK
ncbi:hypothetical protein ACHAW6_001823 [Cyclotella cf. meneghiniana]